jgi:predicted metal-dependent hydrolase
MTSTLPFTYQLRRSHKASYLRIIVSAQKIEVVAPLTVSNTEIQAFVQAKQTWILSTQKKLVLKTSGAANHFDYQTTPILVQNKPYSLELQTSPNSRIKLEFTDRFIVHLPITVTKTEERNRLIKKTLLTWLQQASLPHVNKFVALHSPRYQLNPTSIKIKIQKSRWGSCGIHNDISINGLLLMMPPEVLEYVVVHELCHIQVKNHSADFWRLVHAHLPHYPHHRHWLKQHGHALMNQWLY